jgi:hypothetical protein
MWRRLLIIPQIDSRELRQPAERRLGNRTGNEYVMA